MGNLIPVTEMWNVQKAPKIPVEPRSDLTATLQGMRSWKCFVTDSPGIRAKVFIWEKISNSVTGPARLLIRTHRNFCKEKSGEVRSRKASQPGRPGSSAGLVLRPRGSGNECLVLSTEVVRAKVQRSTHQRSNLFTVTNLPLVRPNIRYKFLSWRFAEEHLDFL